MLSESAIEHLTIAIGAVMKNSVDSISILMQYCSSQLLTMSSTPNWSPSNFTVLQSIVQLLVDQDCTKMANVLATCVLSDKLYPYQREWAIVQFARLVFSNYDPEMSNMVADIAGSLPQPHVQILDAHQARITDMHCHRKKSQLATSAADGTVRIWLDYDNQVFLHHTCVSSSKNLRFVCQNSNGKLVAAADEDSVHLWLTSGGRGLSLSGESIITALAFPATRGFIDGQLGIRSCDFLLVGLENGNVFLHRILDISSETLSTRLDKVCRKNQPVASLAWFDEDKKFAVGFKDGCIVLGGRSPYDEAIILQDKNSNIPVEILSWNPLGTHLASTQTKVVHIWSSSGDDWKIVEQLAHHEMITCLTWYQGDNEIVLAVGCFDGCVHIWR